VSISLSIFLVGPVGGYPKVMRFDATLSFLLGCLEQICMYPINMPGETVKKALQ